jgi:predicted RNase H-related nuclease YkuK (DUF458 family)
MEFDKQKWTTPSRGEFTFDGLENSIRQHIKEHPNDKFEVVVGTDSQAIPSIKSIRFVNTIIVRRMGKGAIFYIRKEYLPNMVLRQKIWQEVMQSYEIINELKDRLADILPKESFIPHVDVGEKGETRTLIREVTGIFLSEGYDVKYKPDSYGSSSVADKYSK